MIDTHPPRHDQHGTVTRQIRHPQTSALPGFGHTTIQSLAMKSLAFFLPQTFFLLPALVSSTYTLDKDWPRGMPEEATYFSAIAVTDTGEVHISVRMNATSPILVFTPEGDYLEGWGGGDISQTNEGVWGAHGLAFQEDGQGKWEGEGPRIWVADIQAHTALVFSSSPKPHTLTGTAGTPNKEGSGTTPYLQFGSTADVATGTGEDYAGSVWVTDGDGGINDRVVRLDTSQGDTSIGAHPDWLAGNGAEGGATTATFNSPHSIAFLENAGLLAVADRDDNRLVFLDAGTGGTVAILGGECLGSPVTTGRTAPWGVRIVPGGVGGRGGGDRLAVAVCDRPESGKNQRVVIIDVDGLGGGCTVVETVEVDPAE